jgi:hypothetical protein
VDVTKFGAALALTAVVLYAGARTGWWARASNRALIELMGRPRIPEATFLLALVASLAFYLFR